MRILSMVTALLMLSAPSMAQTPSPSALVQLHVMPLYQTLTEETATLARVAQKTCHPESPALRAAYHTAFDAWIRASHLRFGPSEREDRAFSLAFWPDPRGSTPKVLARLFQDQDSVVDSPETFATVSVAARGFYALEFLLYDPQFQQSPQKVYACGLVQAITTDIARNAAAIRSEWEDHYGALVTLPGNDTYRTSQEVAQQFFTALSTGLQFTSDVRLGRPLGTFQRPRPTRAEARRSGRSLRHVVLSLGALRQLARLVSDNAQDLDRAFEIALARANALGDATFQTVADPSDRIAVEALRQRVDDIRAILAQNVGPALGMTAGFNSLDGD